MVGDNFPSKTGFADSKPIKNVYVTTRTVSETNTCLNAVAIFKVACPTLFSFSDTARAVSRCGLPAPRVWSVYYQYLTSKQWKLLI